MKLNRELAGAEEAAEKKTAKASNKTDMEQDVGATIGQQNPWLWAVRMSAEAAPAVMSMLDAGTELPLVVLLSNPSGREPMLRCVPMCLLRNGEMTVLPSGELWLQPDDELLLCGSRHASRQLDSQGHPLNKPADAAKMGQIVGVKGEISLYPSGALQEELYRRVLGRILKSFPIGEPQPLDGKYLLLVQV